MFQNSWAFYLRFSQISNRDRLLLGPIQVCHIERQRINYKCTNFFTTLQKRKRWMHQIFNICKQMVSCWLMLLMLYLPLLDIYEDFLFDSNFKRKLCQWRSVLCQILKSYQDDNQSKSWKTSAAREVDTKVANLLLKVAQKRATLKNRFKTTLKTVFQQV